MCSGISLWLVTSLHHPLPLSQSLSHEPLHVPGILGEGMAPLGKLPKRIQEAALVVSGRREIWSSGSPSWGVSWNSRRGSSFQSRHDPHPVPQWTARSAVWISKYLPVHCTLHPYPQLSLPASHWGPDTVPHGMGVPQASREPDILLWHKNRLPLPLVSYLMFSHCNLTLTLRDSSSFHHCLMDGKTRPGTVK